MGRASSSKKVARAARAGGSSGPNQRKLGFPLAIVAIVVLGLGLVVFARNDFSSASATPPTVDDHWHTAYGVYVCDTFQAPIADTVQDTTGIHTHADGVIHVHPFAAGSAGKNATLSKWGQIVGMEFGGSSITLQDGTKLKDGFDCNGNTDTTLAVYKWAADDPDAEPIVYTKDFGGIRLDGDREALTIAVVPTGTTPPRPESIPTLDALTDLEPATTVPVPTTLDPTATTPTTVVVTPTTAPDAGATDTTTAAP